MMMMMMTMLKMMIIIMYNKNGVIQSTCTHHNDKLDVIWSASSICDPWTHTRLLTLPLPFATLLTATVITSSERQCSHFRLKVLSLLPRQEDSSPFQQNNHHRKVRTYYLPERKTKILWSLWKKFNLKLYIQKTKYTNVTNTITISLGVIKQSAYTRKIYTCLIN